MEIVVVAYWCLLNTQMYKTVNKLKCFKAFLTFGSRRSGDRADRLYILQSESWGSVLTWIFIIWVIASKVFNCSDVHFPNSVTFYKLILVIYLRTVWLKKFAWNILVIFPFTLLPPRPSHYTSNFMISLPLSPLKNIVRKNTKTKKRQKIWNVFCIGQLLLAMINIPNNISLETMGVPFPACINYKWILDYVWDFVFTFHSLC